MSDNCPVCTTSLKEKRQGGGYDCPRCGRFCITDQTISSLPRLFDTRSPEDYEKRSCISHAIRKMQKAAIEGGYWPNIECQLIREIIKRPLPSVTEQANNLILWYGNNFPPGKRVQIDYSNFQSIIGAKSPEGVLLIIQYLINRKLIADPSPQEIKPDSAKFKLTVEGLLHYEEINRGSVGCRKTFMAMKYGDKQLEEIFEKYLKPAVRNTGFELVRLDEHPKAGLIDDRLRVEIRTSRFLISDLTHENAGAYWEAGYAEGLGKPVIYTCEKKKFNEAKTHFDTNHHLTVLWCEDDPQEAVSLLKATIRATLPDEAKMTDD